MEQTFDETPRTYVIRRSQHKGYGFVAGYEFPTMVKRVEDDGPSFERLQPGDVIMAVNGIDVQDTSREQIIKMIQLSNDHIEITVRKLSYGELIRAKNLANPEFYQLNNNNNNNNGNKSSYHNNATMSTTTTKSMQYHNPLSVDNQWQFNRLVTPISQQQHQNLKQPSSQNSTSNSTSELDTPSSVQVSRHHNNSYGTKPLLEHKSSINQQSKLDKTNNNNNTIVKGDNFIDITKKNNGASYGRFSPVPQRCKSSMDGAQGNQRNKKSNNEDHEQPLLKRRNTMRPIKPTTIMPPPEVRKILQSVIKIFFEDGHSRALKYDPTTTVGGILDILNERLGKSPDQLEQVKGYFGLALTFEVESSCKLKDKVPLHILNESDVILKIAQLHYSDRLRLLYRIIHPPSDIYGLYKQSKWAFEYLYQQSRNDLKLGRFSTELDEDIALKLSALHLLEYVHSNHSKAHGNSKDPKVYIELIKKTRGIEYFVPAVMVESVLDKDGRRIASQYKKLKAKLIKQLKKNFEEFNLEPPQVKSTTDINRFSTTSFHELILPEMHSSPSDYIKLLFLNYLSELMCYENPKKPVKASTSPMEQTSSGDCSSSLESVPRTSDSSPLIKQDRNQFSHMNNGVNIAASISNNSNLNTTNNGRPNNMNINSIARLPQMNSLRSLNSIRSPSQSQSVDQTDMAATPSIESISSITFNIQNSPSPPEVAPPYLASSSELYNNNLTTSATTVIGGLRPSPMPRHQVLSQKRPDSNSIDKLYNQRYLSRDRYIDDLPRNIIILPPPPPPSSLMFDDIKYQLASGKMVNYHSPSSMHLTQVLTDKDIEKLRVPPPPKLTN